MAKSSRPTGFEAVVCDKCHAEAHALKASKHRWCGGSKATRKHNKVRGTWR